MNERKRMLNWISLVCNCVLFVMILVTYLVQFNSGSGNLSTMGWQNLKFFTVLSNLFLGLASLLMIPFNLLVLLKKRESLPLFVQIVKEAAVTSVMITFFTVMLFLIPTIGIEGMLSGPNFIFHLVAPLIGFFAFIATELHPTLKLCHVFFALIPVLLYAAFYLLNFELKWTYSVIGEESTYDWYGFAGDGNPIRIMVVLLIMAFATVVLSLGVYSLNRVLRILLLGYDDNEGKLIEETEGKDVYHVGKYLSRHWEIRKAGETKPLSQYPTKEEALENAKERIHKDGGSIRLHG